MNQEALRAAAVAFFDRGDWEKIAALKGEKHALSDISRAIFAYLDAMKARGWRLVPEEPTEEMAIEGAQYLSITPGGAKPRTAIDVWDAMISAAPEHGEAK